MRQLLHRRRIRAGMNGFCSRTLNNPQ
jgi:hypothetical protein